MWKGPSGGWTFLCMVLHRRVKCTMLLLVYLVARYAYLSSHYKIFKIIYLVHQVCCIYNGPLCTFNLCSLSMCVFLMVAAPSSLPFIPFHSILYSFFFLLLFFLFLLRCYISNGLYGRSLMEKLMAYNIYFHNNRFWSQSLTMWHTGWRSMLLYCNNWMFAGF